MSNEQVLEGAEYKLGKRVGVCLGIVINVASVLVVPFPWWLPAPFLERGQDQQLLGRAKRMGYGRVRGLVGRIIWSWGYVINTAAAFVTVHMLPPTIDRLHSWEVGLAGWSASMCLLFTVDSLNVYAGGSSPEVAKALLRAFGVSVDRAGDTERWSFALVSLITALVCWTLADWILHGVPAFECGHSANLTADGNYECLRHQMADSTTPGECCQVVSDSREPITLISSLGGSVASGYALINRLATFLIWSDDTVERRKPKRNVVVEPAAERMAQRDAVRRHEKPIGLSANV